MLQFSLILSSYHQLSQTFSKMQISKDGCDTAQHFEAFVTINSYSSTTVISRNVRKTLHSTRQSGKNATMWQRARPTAVTAKASRIRVQVWVEMWRVWQGCGSVTWLAHTAVGGTRELMPPPPWQLPQILPLPLQSSSQQSSTNRHETLHATAWAQAHGKPSQETASGKM